ncbi:hypothetical protein V5P93_006773 [Actinokineospora auranticolor]|uniref:Uncharacterized protein n=1 Tax=Actinokineospora auranticolor TaxID=155976 RepID=A0A2S6GWG3_9PSEU|nr:hypothetical protein [Actinokineospora auranticolor]PPK69582.1 hypothetical protein CLV40_103192 [Actinokineospora auranticolor]
MAENFSHGITDALQVPSDVYTEDHSAKMLEPLETYIKLLGRDFLGFLYEKWRSHPACLPANANRWKEQPVAGDGWQEKTDQSGGLWKIKIINWGFIWGARGRLDNLAKAAAAMDGTANAISGKLHGAWTSKAGDAATTKINDLRAAAQEYGTAVGELRANIEGAWHASRGPVERLSQFAGSGTGGKSLADRYGANAFSDNTDFIDFPRDKLATYIDEMGRILQNGTFRSGIYAKEEWTAGYAFLNEEFTPGLPFDDLGCDKQTAETLHQPGKVLLTDGDNRWSNEICNELNDFCNCYFTTMANLRRQIEETITAVTDAWRELNSGSMLIATDPFGKLALSGADKPPPDDESGDEKPPTKKDPGTGTGSTDTGTGTGDQPKQQQMPPPPKAEDLPQMPDPGQVDQGTDPSAVDPTQTPGAVPGTTGGAPETVTISEGGRTIGVQSPDGAGHVKVTVDDGSGKPKTYDLDFGASTPGQGQLGPDGKPVVGPDGKPITDGAEGRPLGPDGRPVNGVDAQTRGMPVDGAIGPDGRPVDGAIGPDGKPVDVQHVQAGPDGKAVIHDGDVTITAERDPGSPDTVKITVDDGTGEPVSYTVDFDETTQGATGGAQHGGPATDTAGQATGTTRANPDGGQPGHQPEPGRPGVPPAGQDQPTPGGQVPGGGTHGMNDASPIGHGQPGGQVPGGGTHGMNDASPIGHGQPAPGGQVPGQVAPGGHGVPGYDAAQSGHGMLNNDAAQPGHPQATYAASGGGSAWSSDAWGASGSIFDEQPRDQLGPHPGHDQSGQHGQHDNGHGGDTQTAGAGEAGLASAASGLPGDQSGTGSPMGGGMPMGAMGGGGQGQGGGDSERGGSQWRTTGQLFDDDYADAEARISGSFDGGR